MIDGDPYNIALVTIGLAMLAAVWLPKAVFGRAASLAVVPLAVGAGLFAVVPGLSAPDPLSEPGRLVWEKLTEAVVVISLVGAGLRIKRRGWAEWRAILLLLAVVMPATFLLTAVIGRWAGLSLAGAVLLGACVSPTDPVLASDVQNQEPDDPKSDLRFALTGEAGFNDGLAFPLVYLAIAIALAGEVSAGVLGEWLAWDVVYRCAVAGVGGVGVGWLMGKLLYRQEEGKGLASADCGSLMLCLYFLAYGMTELLQGYGFIAAFVAAMVVRRMHYDHGYNKTLSRFAAELEHGAVAVMLVLLGGLVVPLAEHMTWTMAGVALALVLVIRPVVGYAALVGHRFGFRHRIAIAFFGVRGVGTIYYLAYAFGKADFEERPALWAAGLLVVLLSAVVHGFSSVPAMRWVHRSAAGDEERAGAAD
ncbi:MAG: cation:proton antiporter [Planctomycetota bacterium]